MRNTGVPATTADVFEVVSRADPALAEEALDEFDRENRTPPAGTPPSPWRTYLATHSHADLPTSGDLIVYRCRPLTPLEVAHAAEVQHLGGYVSGWIAVIGLSLNDIAGPRPVSREDIERERRDFGGFRRVPPTSSLWSDASIWPGGAWGAIQSVCGQIDARSALTETESTFRPAGRPA